MPFIMCEGRALVWGIILYQRSKQILDEAERMRL